MFTKEDIDKLLLPQEHFLAFLKHHQEWVADCLKDPTEDWMPMLAIQTKAGLEAEPELTLCALALENFGDQKYRALYKLGQGIWEKKEAPVAVVFSSEAWFAKANTFGMPPSACPDRQEMLQVVGMRLGQQGAAQTFAPITRGEGNRILLGEWSEILTEGVTSNLLWEFYRGFFGKLMAQRG